MRVLHPHANATMYLLCTFNSSSITYTAANFMGVGAEVGAECAEDVFAAGIPIGSAGAADDPGEPAELDP